MSEGGMVMKNRFFILLFAVVFLFTVACDRDHLYYAYSERATVKINIDWFATNVTPNGVSAYVFPHESQGAFREPIISGVISTIDVELAEGCYDILLINDTEYELNNIDFTKTGSIEEFRALIAANTESKYEGISTSSNQGFSTDCDDVAYAIIDSVVIDRNDVEYYKDKPNSDTIIVSKVFEAKLKQITEIIDIELKVENINSAAGAPRSHLTNMAGGYVFYNGEKHHGLVTHEFVLNNRTIDPNNPKIGKISKRLVCFGPPMTKEGSFLNTHKLIMKFILNNGDLHPIELELNPLLETKHNGVQFIHKIRSTVTLPETIGNGGGAFDPDIEEWEDVEVGFPI